MNPSIILEDIIIITSLGTLSFAADIILEKMNKIKIKNALNIIIDIGIISYVIFKGVIFIKEIGRGFYI